MFARPLVLCPTDFSEPSRGALRYAGALAEHFYADLMVLAVDDPFLSQAAAAALDTTFVERQTRAALSSFVDETFAKRRPQVPELRQQVVTGRPAETILRCAGDVNADIVVMSTHGTGGIRKLVFGSVTEQVLRQTHVPVLVTPGSDAGPQSLEAWTSTIRRLLVPVDFSAWTPRQVAIARGVAEALGSQLLFAHVMPDGEGPSREEVHHRLDAIIRSVPASLRPTMMIYSGDPATEIARIVRERQADMIVMGLHSDPGRHQRMGSVTYAVLRELPVLVLAWPPARDERLSVRKAQRDVIVL
jgi:nucleotide-binding universal stress UspA family protein